MILNPPTNSNRLFFIFVTLALLLKLFLFFFTTTYSPNGKFEEDSMRYLTPGIFLVQDGVFAQERSGPHTYVYETFRTPGYPLFLGLLHHTLRISLNGIIFIQVLLSILAAFLVYRLAYFINPQLAPLSTIIVLFDPPINVFSLIILTDILFLIFIILFALAFVRYLKDRQLIWLILSAIILAASVYIRPVAYFLGIAVAGFIIGDSALLSKNKVKNRALSPIVHTLIFLILVYSLVGLWHYRNATKTGMKEFCTIGNATYKVEGLLNSYNRNHDKLTQGWPPPLYYASVTTRCIISFFTRPASFKYFDNKILTKTGKVFAYPWCAFWMIGFLAGLTRIKDNPSLQFFAFMILYFASVTVISTMWGSGPRFLIPCVPFIAIISAYGWMILKNKTETKNLNKINYKKTLSPDNSS
jgi:hypothetical protein